jgi:hypothetical protein
MECWLFVRSCEPLPLFVSAQSRLPPFEPLTQSPLLLFFPSFPSTHAITIAQITLTCPSLLPLGT